MPFNQAQCQAIEHGAGPMMVLAGPGSGKTTVITHRIQNLIQKQGVRPSNILVITFTKAAAVEMQDRYEKLMDGEQTNGRVSFGTFHSVFFQILRYAYRFDGASIVREDQKKAYIRKIMEPLNLELEDEADFISGILGEISLVKGEMLDMSHYYAKNCSETVFKQIYDGYDRCLRQANLIDFDDMLVMCYELFKERPDILAAWQKKYQYILIDEFQDINRIQYEIVRMLAEPEKNLFIVGDDDQSIYRFRGARPEIMLGFEKDYPETRKVLLNVNYRSTKSIVEAAGRLILRNQTRFPKEIQAEQGLGKPVTTMRWDNPKEETAGAIQEIMDYQKAGYRYSDIAILVRTNLGARLIVEKLMEYNIPFRMKDSLPNLYEHWISIQVLTYIRMAHGDLDRGTVLQVINRPNRYVSRDTLTSQTVSWDDLKYHYRDKDWMVERIDRLEYDLLMLRTMPPVAAVNYIRKAVGYDDYIREYAMYRRIKSEDLLEVLDQLQESAAGFKTYEEWMEHMADYKEQLGQQSRQRTQESEGVALMTMHSSKGLEFKIVYLLDVNEGVSPHQKAVLDVNLEEERRMFYVAMTRAKERLHVNYVQERYGKKQAPSRFIHEYLTEPENYKKTIGGK